MVVYFSLIATQLIGDLGNFGAIAPWGQFSSFRFENVACYFLHRGSIKTCQSIFAHNFDKRWPISKMSSPLDSAVHLPRDPCHISLTLFRRRLKTYLFQKSFPDVLL